MGTTAAGQLLEPMVKTNVILNKDGHYLDELGTRLLADSQHVDIRRTNRRWAVYRKQRGEYRRAQRRHNQGQADAILYLRRHGYHAFPAMGVVIEYWYNRRHIRVTPDAFVILPPGVLVAIEFERSAKAPSRVRAKAGNYNRLAEIGRPIPVLFITETMEAARNFASLQYPYLLATTLEAVREGPHGRAVVEENRVAGDPWMLALLVPPEERPSQPVSRSTRGRNYMPSGIRRVCGDCRWTAHSAGSGPDGTSCLRMAMLYCPGQP